MEKSVRFVLILLTGILLLYNLLFLDNGAENIITGLIADGTMDLKYLSTDGWIYNYHTIKAHKIALLIFIALFVVANQVFHKSKVPQLALLAIYIIVEIIIIAQFVELGGLIGLQTCLFSLLGYVVLRFR